MVKMVCLTLHRTDSCIKKEEPVVNFVGFTGTFGVANEMFGVVLLDQILHYGTGLKESNRFPVGKGVCEGGNTAIGIQCEIPVLFLDAGLHIDSVDFV